MDKLLLTKPLVKKGIFDKILSEPVVERRVAQNKTSSEIPANVVKFDRKREKKCIKCREVKPLEKFGRHDDNADGKQTLCYECKGKLGRQRQMMNVRARLRHHMATRITSQLGRYTPEGLTRDLEEYLGYNMSKLVRGLSERLKMDYPDLRLRDVLNDGWHVDHIHPLSRFTIVDEALQTVDWDKFRDCWDVDNLRAIPAEDNLKKGSKVSSSSQSPDQTDGSSDKDPF